MRVHSWHSCQKGKFQCFLWEPKSQLTLWLLEKGPDCLGNPLQSHSPNVFPRIMTCCHELEQALPASICVKVAVSICGRNVMTAPKGTPKIKKFTTGKCPAHLYIITYMGVLPGRDPTISYLPWIFPFSQSFSNTIFFAGLDPPTEFHKLSN